MRHEPGKNFAKIGVPVVPGPQTQEFTVVPNAGWRQAVKVVTFASQGAKRIVPLAPVATFCVVTITVAPPVAPGFDAVVATELTYFVPEPALTSQPQPFAATAAPELAD